MLITLNSIKSRRVVLGCRHHCPDLIVRLRKVEGGGHRRIESHQLGGHVLVHPRVVQDLHTQHMMQYMIIPTD